MTERGATLLEWMLAMVLNALVVLILTQGIMAARTSFSMTDDMARLADNGRFAQDALLEAISEANHRLACARDDTDSSLEKINALSPDVQHWLDAPLIGWEAHGTSGVNWSLSTPSSDESGFRVASHSASHTGLPASIQARVDPQSDVLMVHQLRPIPGVEIIHVSNQEIRTRYNHGLKACSIVAITDCTTDVIFQTTQSDPRSLAWAGSTCEAGDISMSIKAVVGAWPTWPSLGLYRFERTAWFVGPSDNGTRTLYRAFFDQGKDHAHIEAMAENIETLQLEYAIRSTTGITAWQTADQISDWSFVIGVRFATLVSAPNPQSAEVIAPPISLPMLSGEVMWPPAAGYARVFGSASAIRSVLSP